MKNFYAEIKENLDKGKSDFIIIEEAGYLCKCLSFSKVSDVYKDGDHYCVDYLESWEDGRDDVEPLYDDADYNKLIKWIYDEGYDNGKSITNYLKERGLL